VMAAVIYVVCFWDDPAIRALKRPATGEEIPTDE
jgi:hypothetical protein